MILALLPGVAAMTWYFGLGVPIKMALAIVAAVGFEAEQKRASNDRKS